MAKKALGPQLEAARIELRAVTSERDTIEFAFNKFKKQLEVAAQTNQILQGKIDLLEEQNDKLKSFETDNRELRIENRLLKEDRAAMREMFRGNNNG